MSQLVQDGLTPHLAGETSDNLELLRDTSISQETWATAHAELEDDADLENLITNLFTQAEVSDMAHYWGDFLSRII